VNFGSPAPGIRTDQSYEELKQHLIGATGLAYYADGTTLWSPLWNIAWRR
jgi:hypothetical protein